jgi:hypothetical protein
MDDDTRGLRSDEPVIDRTGKRYQVGHVSDGYEIYDAAGPPGPVARFSKDNEGWQQAWAEFVRLEAVVPEPPPPRRPSLVRRLKNLEWETIGLPLLFVCGLFAIAMWGFIKYVS